MNNKLLYPHLLKNVIMPIADKIMDTKYMYYLRFIEKMNKWSSLEIEEWQNELLINLISHAYNNTKYYNELMKRMKLSPSDIRVVEDLKKLPVLKKEYVAKHYDEFVPGNINNFRFIKNSTGGSTGDPMRFLSDIDFLCFAQANRIYSWQQFGYNYGDKYAVLGSSSLISEKAPSLQHKILYTLTRKVPFNGMNISDEKALKYLDDIKAKKIKFIYGYASSLYLLAKFAMDNDYDVPEITACFSTSEILTDVYRNAIKKAFNCKVMDCYGAADGGIMGYEINKGYYHVGYNSIAEINDQFGTSSGKVLSTNIKDFSFPLIKYEIGDEVDLLSEDLKSYSFNGQVIKKIYGRKSDVIRLENGNVLTGPGFTILFKDLNVKGYQILKEKELCIKITIQKGDQYSTKEEKLIYSTFKKYAGKDCEILISYVDRFETLSNGKVNYFIS
jgi:phenylacetate-CoA ligase